MNALEVRLFGGVGVSLNGGPTISFPTRWAGGLLAYLALNKGRPIHRDVVAAQFWPEETDQRARKRLRNALWRVRSTMEPHGVPPGSFLTVTGRTLCLEREGVWLDVEEFDGRMVLIRREVEEEARLLNLAACVDLYRGDFMDGHDYEWCVYERERLRLVFVSALEHLLESHLEGGDLRQAIVVGQSILRIDPLREHIHRMVMICHHLRGNRPLAIRQYRECIRVLDEELSVPPMKETQNLYREIMTETLGDHLDRPGQRVFRHLSSERKTRMARVQHGS